MPRTRRLAVVHVLAIGLIALAGPPHTLRAGPRSAVSEVSLPGGLAAALAALGDVAAPDRAQFLVEFIRRTYDTPITTQDDPRAASLRALAAALRPGPGRTTQPATLPLPLTPGIWIDAVFGGRATADTLVSDIVQSRSAALFYCGLLALDDDTRDWLAARPALISELASRFPSAFLAAAPGLRIAGAGLRLPGGPAAAAVWQSLVGHRPDEPVEVVRALLTIDDGALAVFLGAIAQLTPAQAGVLLNLDADGVQLRVESARRMYLVFRRTLAGRSTDRRAFTRPPIDPTLLIAELAEDRNGRPIVPGSRQFWIAVFRDDGPRPAAASREEGHDAASVEEPADFPWLCDQVFKGEPLEQHHRYVTVLFASRLLARTTPIHGRDAVDAVRAVTAYPALTVTIERAGVTDAAVFAAAARRAASLAAIDDDDRAFRALAQFQGALALIARAASRGSLAAGRVSELVTSLAAVPLSRSGDYEGRLACWLDAWMQSDAHPPRPSPSHAASPGEESAAEILDSAAGPTERDVLGLLAGPIPPTPRMIEWEGTRYRVDLARAEAIRLTRLLGDAPRPYLSAAAAIVRIADALDEPGLTRDRLQREAAAFAGIAHIPSGTSERSSWPLPDRSPELMAAVRRSAEAGDIRNAARLAPVLRLFADDLLARGLTEIAYAAALGQRDDVAMSAADAASRHDFGVRSVLRRSAPWRIPQQGSDVTQHWRVGGALVGLDVALADFSLVRLSSKLPARRPTLADSDRVTFIEMVALVEPAALTDADRDTIVAAIEAGRVRLAGARTPDEALAIADAIHLSAVRRTLLAWVVVHEPERTAVFLSPSELLWLGLGAGGVDSLHAWGAPAGPRLGCSCLRVIDRRPWEIFAGRVNAGMPASAFPDLNLRLAELLAELRMPAVLLAPVLTSATLDFVNSAISRDGDDRRGLVEFVQGLRSDRVEQYLALLTTDGPLVPVGHASQASPATPDGARPGRRQ